MTAQPAAADSTKVGTAAAGSTGKDKVHEQYAKKHADLDSEIVSQKSSPNIGGVDSQQLIEDSGDALKSVATVPKKPAWGLPSALPGAASAATVGKKGNPVHNLSFAEIMNDQSRDRAAARAAYSNNIIDETVSLTQIQSEQERLFAMLDVEGKKQASSASVQDVTSVTGRIGSEIYEDERKMIEMAMKQSLLECNSVTSDGKNAIKIFETAEEEAAADLVSIDTVKISEENAEREMIEAAIREADAREEHNDGTVMVDAKPAAKITDSTLEDSEKEMIEAAILKADAKERTDGEIESLKLIMKLQQEEAANFRQRQRQHHSTMPTGNVRTMTRAEFAAETYADNNQILTYNYNQYDHFSDHGFRMNQQSQHQLSGWYRRDRNTIVGPDNEIRTKHDVKVQGQTNASFLDLDVIDDDTGLRTHVGNTAFNAFRKTVAGSYHTKGGHRGTSKGVVSHGTGRAGSDADATKGGALDQHVRLHISKAINAGIIERCNGVVKQGKEAVVYHAIGGINTPETAIKESSNDIGQPGTIRQTIERDTKVKAMISIDKNDGFDVAIKVFKRIKEFKGRGEYVDGDPRYAGRPFRSFTDREQLEVWTEKEYRNLIRAYRAEVPVPNPIHYKDNIIFMRFLGEDGWPAPQIREINIRKASSKWTALYDQVMKSVQKLFQDARLVHGDLSEYNILIAPNFQVDNKSENIGSEDDLQTVLIDFGQAVEVRHPKAEELLRRDLERVRDFFFKQGAKMVLSLEDALKYVIGDYSFTVNMNDTKMTTL